MPKQTVITRKVEVACLEKLLKQEARRRIRERLQAILWIHVGEYAQDVAKKIGRSRQAVASYVAYFNDKGLKGLLEIGRGPGRKASLNIRQIEQLLDWIKVGPRALGYSFNLWDCKRLAHHIHKEWGITLSDERLRQILHESGAKVLRPKHKLPQPPKGLRVKKTVKSGPFWRWQRSGQEP